MDDMIKALNCVGYYEKEMCYKDAYNVMRKCGEPEMICHGEPKKNQIKCPYYQTHYNAFLEDEDLRWMKDAADLLGQYKEIGTVEECKIAVEKQKAKKPNDIKNSVIGIMYGYCPTCNQQINVISSESYCIDCGQKLDWESEGENEVN